MNIRLSIVGVALVLAGCGGGGEGAGSNPFGISSGSSNAGGSTGGTSAGATGGTSGGTTGGGTSGGTSSGSAAASAEGIWSGTTSAGYAFNLLVVETGEFWAIYGRSGVAQGAVHGTGSGTATAFNGSGTDFFFADGSKAAATVSGNVVAKSTMTGTVQSFAAATFSAGYDSRYDQPASVADIAGAWPFNAISHAGVQSGSVNIAADGTFAGSISTCSFTGLASPRTGGKNVFNTSISFAASGCVFNGQTLTGVSVVTVSGATRTLFSAALIPDGSNGFLASGTK